MARIPYADPEAPENREAAAYIVASRKKLGHLHRMLLNSPPIAKGWIDLYDAVRWKTELSGKLRELAMCQVAAINGAQYEWAAHAPIALKEGATQAQLDALPDWAAQRGLFDAAETRGAGAVRRHDEACACAGGYLRPGQGGAAAARGGGAGRHHRRL